MIYFPQRLLDRLNAIFAFGGKRQRSIRYSLLVLVAFCFVQRAYAVTPPPVIKIGTLYASSGAFAFPSQGQYQGLKFWAKEVNESGGVYVKAFDKKIPVKIVAYDDQSSTSTATTLYNQLITQDKVDLLTSDFGSVLTSVAIPLAAEHHMLLLDQTGSGANFFGHTTKYLADISIPSSTVWPIRLGLFLRHENIKRVAIVYGANDFDASQANTLKAVLYGGGIKSVYFNSVPTSESNYSVILHSIASTHPDAVIEFGYPNNDIAFFRALSSSGLNFKMVFTIFPGQLLKLLTKNVGSKAMAYTYTYPTPPLVAYKKVNLGMNTSDFVGKFKSVENKDPNFLSVVGYNTGEIIEKMLATSSKFEQTSFDDALLAMSGKTKTLLGDFKITPHGSQTGELFPVGQLVPDNGGNKIVVVYPHDLATAKPIYPAPN